LVIVEDGEKTYRCSKIRGGGREEGKEQGGEKSEARTKEGREGRDGGLLRLGTLPLPPSLPPFQPNPAPLSTLPPHLEVRHPERMSEVIYLRFRQV
jgi:hypothetical protein